MKINYCLVSISILFACFWIESCSLDYDPVSQYSDVTEEINSEGEKPIFVDRQAAIDARTSLHRRFRSGQEHWYLDMLLLNETHSDNAYAGTYGNETTPFAANSIEGSNINLARDWTGHMGNIARANNFIWGVDALPDLTSEEKRQFIAEGKIIRAMIYFDMVRIWGNVPLITTIAGEITSESIVDVYPLYYPPQSDELTLYKQIEEDLLEGLQYAPDDKPNDKDKSLYATLPSKQVARALLAKVYAEKPLQDYDKVIKYADELAADGFDLVEDFEDLWGVALTDPNEPVSNENRAISAKVRHTVESIYEAAYFTGATSWVSFMFGRLLDNWNNNFTWAKWITPSRDIIREYLSEEGDKRYAQAVVWYSCGWSNHYPMDNYAFMFKYRSSFNSIIKIRYADILLLKAEALIAKNDFAGAASIINRTRNRAGLGNLPPSATADKEAILNAYLKERRLELAFEGERWFDLVRHDKVEEVMNSVYERDPDRIPLVYPFDQYSYKLPIPATAIDANPNLVQNPGY
ncbi:MAG: RagB/SusD family nutrient uptake outer membrane protein [Tannerellaceae bacterium]|jgi:hypothetical protein|nr:RagB/SusD family nutrient uptake outer membrane protein [Tannerellaceae bacterium]